MKKDVIVVNESNDKLDCFARISKIKCNALKKKECKNCSFYKKKLCGIPHNLFYVELLVMLNFNKNTL